MRRRRASIVVVSVTFRMRRMSTMRARMNGGRVIYISKESMDCANEATVSGGGEPLGEL